MVRDPKVIFSRLKNAIEIRSDNNIRNNVGVYISTDNSFCFIYNKRSALIYIYLKHTELTQKISVTRNNLIEYDHMFAGIAYAFAHAFSGVDFDTKIKKDLIFNPKLLKVVVGNEASEEITKTTRKLLDEGGHELH